jgi:hypothetical protein
MPLYQSVLNSVNPAEILAVREQGYSRVLVSFPVWRLVRILMGHVTGELILHRLIKATSKRASRATPVGSRAVPIRVNRIRSGYSVLGLAAPRRSQLTTCSLHTEKESSQRPEEKQPPEIKYPLSMCQDLSNAPKLGSLTSDLASPMRCSQ